MSSDEEARRVDVEVDALPPRILNLGSGLISVVRYTYRLLCPEEMAGVPTALGKLNKPGKCSGCFGVEISLVPL